MFIDKPQISNLAKFQNVVFVKWRALKKSTQALLPFCQFLTHCETRNLNKSKVSIYSQVSELQVKKEIADKLKNLEIRDFGMKE